MGLRCFLLLLLSCVLIGSARSTASYVDPILSPDTETVLVECELQGKGVFHVVVVPAWAPIGAERFLELVKLKFFDGMALYRAVKNFLVQV